MNKRNSNYYDVKRPIAQQPMFMNQFSFPPSLASIYPESRINMCSQSTKTNRQVMWKSKDLW